MRGDRGARPFGIQLAYWDISGRLRRSSPDAVRAVVDALGVDPRAPLPIVEPVTVAWEGRIRILLRLRTEPDRLACWVRREDGEEVGESHLTASPRRSGGWEVRMPGRFPFGVHEARVEVGGNGYRTTVISAPRRIALQGGIWGVFAPLYGLWSRGSQGIGDFEDLRRFGEWVAARGGHRVGTLPLLPVFPEDPSPYRPLSRLVWSELFVRLPEDGGSPDGQLVDYPSVFARKRDRLMERSAHLDPAEEAEFQAWRAVHPLVEDYARFRAALERFPPSWRTWPETLRESRNFEGVSPATVRAYAYGQFLAHRQLEHAARAGPGLYLDFPLGVHPDGYDAWRFQHLFVEGVSVGAPPDPFAAQGQDWGFAPLHPLRIREEGYAYLRRCLAHHFRVARLLRVDHVMGLHRLYWIPRGFPASEGVYVRYPADELYALLLLEAWRHGAGVVGEDLGTVPRAVRSRLDRHGLWRMYVLIFEGDPSGGPREPAPNTVASLGTHDTPPFAAFWTGEDVREREALGLVDAERARSEREHRERVVAGLARAFSVDPTDVARALRASLRFLAASRAACVLVNLEDLWQEHRPQNLPGTLGHQYPNWRRRLRYALEDLDSLPEVLSALEAVRLERT
ncbi:MAG: 4-alpha-glucanotransferase [Armatimonadota bacterium]|nr:4-alpha-glucanotransferase [Armatimonadota bacterium]MDR7444187.1 4-alpha-glucanotransferase [Armatimonadota bacterium]MDR7570603.1 4-alpha-glucanotransferase [Armatimonadota bacterium]MDR7614278.1 4-alpha-glucanotransferase [Armatimonadota bacterium]